MKILYHHRIASKDGQYVHLEEIVNAMKLRGHEVFLVGPSIVESDNFGSDGGFVSVMKKHIPGFIYELLEYGYNFYDFFKLFFAIKKFKPDFIYERYNLYFISGLWAKNIFNIPHILEINAPLYKERKKYNGIAIPALAQWAELFAWKKSDCLLPVTQVLKNQILNKVNQEKRIQVIHNGINKERFHINHHKIKNLKNKLKNKMVLGFTGFVREWHGIEQVVDFISEEKNHNLHLLLVGDGPAKEKILKRAEEKGVSEQLTITGIVERNDIASYVSLFDIALQPAVVEYASPLKLFEYLYMGCLIIAPDTENIKEILKDNYNAILFKNKDMNSFKKGLSRAIALSDPKVIRKKAHETIADMKLTWLDNVRRIENIYKDINNNA